jgi:ribosomal protein S18 acetylase RimI-like enzyme
MGESRRVRPYYPEVTFRVVADNLRQSFRVLAAGRPRASVLELPGVSIASLGVTFHMFNAAFPNAHVETRAELDERLRAAKDHFDSQALRWALWICEDFLATGVRRKLSGTCDTLGLRLSSELPGMAAERIRQPSRKLPAMKVLRVDSVQTLHDFRALGSICFHVPIAWFSEVFDAGITPHHPFVCWVGYREGEPVATAATVTANGVIGLYNIATAPDYRQRGYGEAITRHAIDAALREMGSRDDNTCIVLQSTSLGLRLYEQMGFQPVTRILVYSSVP